MADEEIRHIVEELEGELRGFIRSRIASREEAEDLLQEIWFQLSKTLAQKDISNPRSWLYRVARNKIIDSYRKKSTEWLEDYLYDNDWIEEELVGFSEEANDNTFLREQFWEELYEALDHMPESQREVFIMNELEGITLWEIAERKGEKLKTIISRKGYAVRQLRERLQLMFEELVD